MKVLTFRGADIRQLSRDAQQALGPEAMIVRTRVIGGRVPGIEIVAVDAGEVETLRRRLDPGPLERGGANRRPQVIALVGPTGAGKTTTLAKLAVSGSALAGQRAGVLTVDTFRAGAVDQLESYAEVAGFSLEVVYARDELEGAVERLSTDCEVILVDTPGRSPRRPEQNEIWMGIVGALAPDEVHLVLPATLRLEVALAAQHAYAGVTHLLPTKLDEVEEDAGLADLAVDLRMPARWVTDGQAIPGDLHPALPRILGALGGYSGVSRTRAEVPL